MSAAWHPVKVPPLRTDISRRVRAHRRHLSRIERRSLLVLTGLVSITANVLLYHALSGGITP